MNGADALVQSILQSGVSLCLANAGTTELPIVIALDGEPRIRKVLGLFEGVCTGAADGYGRLLDKPAMALLHLGPGLANGIANLHNARRAKTPLVVIIGEHATWHRHADPPLAMDIDALAGTVSGWHRRNGSSGDVWNDVADAVSASLSGQIATLVVPSDHQWAACAKGLPAAPQRRFDAFEESDIDAAVRLLKGPGPVGIMLGGKAIRTEGLREAARVSLATGCHLMTESFPGFLERGEAYPDVVRIPYFPEPALEYLGQYRGFVLIGMQEPVTFFGYSGIPGFLIRKDQITISLTPKMQNPLEAIRILADALGTANKPATPNHGSEKRSPFPAPAGGPLTPENICLTIAALMPDRAILVDEGLTTSIPLYSMTKDLSPHSYLTIAGGSIGYGMPCATGAALACPDRTVINIQADGSAAYTMQALWTQARERLNVKTLICSNRGYNIIRVEMARAGITSMGPGAKALTDIKDPDLNWSKIAEGMGVPAVAVDSVESLRTGIARIMSEKGPGLIDMAVRLQ